MAHPNGRSSLKVGEWIFDPSTGELSRGDEVRRVEPRAARALELLCDADGGIVSQDEFVAKVWDGRALSENSLSVVIGQLRRALDDDPREPRIVETIPKRGYRLRTASAQALPKGSRRRGLIVIAMTVLAALTIWAWIALRSPDPLVVGFSEVVNATGDARHAALARATSELLVDRLSERGFAVGRGRPGDLDMRSKLIIWDGRPFLSITATDGANTVRWTAMLDASPGKVPPNVERALDELAVQFPPADGAGRVAKGQ